MHHVPEIGAPAGRQLSNVPDLTLSFSTTYRFDAFAGTNGFARVDIQHVGSMYNEVGDIGRPRVEQPSYELVNFRIGLETDQATCGSVTAITNNKETP